MKSLDEVRLGIERIRNLSSLMLISCLLGVRVCFSRTYA